MGYDGDGDGDELRWRWMSAVWRCQSREGGGRIRPEGTQGGRQTHACRRVSQFQIWLLPLLRSWHSLWRLSH